MKSYISALILTRNEQDMIEDCLEQLDFADEIIILDQNSKDKTRKIASKYTDKIFLSRSDDFSKNRNELRDRAKGEWLLYVDADERLSSDLISEIRAKISENQHGAYKIPRKNFVLGKWLKHGGWWPDYVPRLFKRDKLIRWAGIVHESPQIDGDFGYLKNPIEHLTARSMSKMLEKSIKWAKIEADLYVKSTNPKVTFTKVIKAPISEFFSRYILKLGILDGRVGLIEAVYQAIHRVMVLAYLWDQQQKEK